MAKQKHRQSKVSSGKMKGIRKAREEKRNRIAKAKSSRSEYAIWKSMNQKLDVELAKIAAKEALEKRKNKKAKTADSAA